MRHLAKISILAAVLIISSFELIAQTTVKVIPKVGFTVSRFDANWDDFQDYENGGRVGWQAGADVRIGKFLYFAPGLHYTSSTVRNVKSSEIENNNFTFGDEMTLRGIKLPINAGFKIPLLGLRAQAGIVPAYVLNIKDGSGNTFDPVLLNRMTASTSFGVGIDILFLAIDLTYEKGLTNYFENIDIKNNTFALTVGVKF